MGNSASTNTVHEQNENIVANQNNSWKNAVNGDTEALSIAPNVTHAAFETTSDAPLTVSESLGAIPVKNNESLSGGDLISFGASLYNQLSSLLQDTEGDADNFNGGIIESKLNEIRSLLEETETNNLVGGDLNNTQKLRDLLLQDTETFINFRGGALENEELFDHLKKKHNKSESAPVKMEEVKEVSEVSEVNEVPEVAKEEQQNTDQSGGSELDTELKGILKELQTNAKNYKGGKSSRKSSKKSKASKKQSRRSTEESNMSNGTYDIDTEGGSDDEDYLTSTSSMRTSDINIKHYRS